MTDLQLLKYQIKMAQELSLQLVNELDDRFWKLTPPGVNTNINWQVGHIAVSLYYHAIVCMGSSVEALRNLLPLQEFVNAYKTGTFPESNLQDKPGKEELLKSLRIIYRQVEVTLESMKEEELNEEVRMADNTTKTKREVLILCSHHQMWHNGLISLLKRILLGKGFQP